jgi:hypothetical protein
MLREIESAAPPGIGKASGTVLAALLLTGALVQSAPARAGQHGGEFHGGIHDGGFHAGGFHGGGFHGGGFHGGGFQGGFHGGFAGRPHHGFGAFHAERFHGREFHHHAIRRGVVLAPVFGGLSLGAELGWPYAYPDAGYYGQGPYTQYWYCENPPGYYPSVTQCNTGWQTVPAN